VLCALLARINSYLVRGLRKKYKRLKSYTKAVAAWRRIISQYPKLFAHWAWVRWPWQTG
jgi:RNA-directed DNA polymerase